MLCCAVLCSQAVERWVPPGEAGLLCSVGTPRCAVSSRRQPAGPALRGFPAAQALQELSGGYAASSTAVETDPPPEEQQAVLHLNKERELTVPKHHRLRVLPTGPRGDGRRYEPPLAYPPPHTTTHHTHPHAHTHAYTRPLLLPPQEWLQQRRAQTGRLPVGQLTTASSASAIAPSAAPARVSWPRTQPALAGSQTGACPAGAPLAPRHVLLRVLARAKCKDSVKSGATRVAATPQTTATPPTQCATPPHPRPCRFYVGNTASGIGSNTGNQYTTSSTRWNGFSFKVSIWLAGWLAGWLLHRVTRRCQQQLQQSTTGTARPHNRER